MPVMDDIKESHSKLEGKGFKYRVKYFWDYYRVTTLVVVLVAIFLFSIIKTIVTAKTPAFEVIFMNAIATPDQTEFAKEIEIDEKKYEVVFDAAYNMNVSQESYDQATYTTAQKLMAVVASGTADAMLCDPSIAEYYSSSDIFADLRDIYSKEELALIEDKLVWFTPVNPETGESLGYEVPYAIDVTDSATLNSIPCFLSEKVYMMVVVNTKHTDYVKEFYNYLYK